MGTLAINIGDQLSSCQLCKSIIPPILAIIACRIHAFTCRFPQVGTLAFMAPEVLSHGLHSMASDVYSFGMILYEICRFIRLCEQMCSVVLKPEAIID